MDLADLLNHDVVLTRSQARSCLDRLTPLWNVQAPAMKAPPRSIPELADVATLRIDLDRLHHWFNPTATGKRLRESIDALPLPGRLWDSIEATVADLGDMVEPVDQQRALVTPEGRIAMWLFASLDAGQAPTAGDESAGGYGPGAHGEAWTDSELWLNAAQVSTAWTSLAALYRSWNRQRLSNVLGLLREETATLRPSAIGLLFLLLVNRNTAKERRLPSVDDAEISRQVSDALAAPALAFVNALSDNARADARGLEVYRGWAIGEIARRLGSGLHRDQGIWIAETAVPTAEQRLIDALLHRPAEQLARVHAAVDAGIAAYRDVRPALVALGAGHERASATNRLRDRITRAVEDAGGPPRVAVHDPPKVGGTR